MTISDIRRHWLLVLLETEKGRPKSMMARRINRSPSQLSQWLSGYRSISEGTARDIEQAYNKPTGWMDRPPILGGEPLEAHPASHITIQTPAKVSWEALLMRDLPDEFETELPDQSMAPSAPKGSRVIFVTDVASEPGDWVLVRDRDGRHHMRELRQTVPGRWQAHAINPAFLPLDSERDGLKVVAVFDGIRGRRSAR